MKNTIKATDYADIQDYFDELRKNGITPRDQVLDCIEKARAYGSPFLNETADRLEEFDRHMMEQTLYKRVRKEIEPMEEFSDIYTACYTSTFYSADRIREVEMPTEEKELRIHLYKELWRAYLRVNARWSNEEYTPGIRPPKKKPESILDELPYFDDMPPGYYKKYDEYDAININKVKEIPIDYEGVMGVPISVLDKEDIMNHMEIVGGTTKRQSINGKTIFYRILCRWCWAKELNALYTGEPINVFGGYHSMVKFNEERGVKVIVEG